VLALAPLGAAAFFGHLVSFFQFGNFFVEFHRETL
jgi:hypothetical protein